MDRPLRHQLRPDLAGTVQRIRYLLFRAPFAAALWAVVALTGLASGTWAHQLPPQVLHRWGTGLHQLLHGRVWTLLTGGAFSHGPFMYWALILALIPLGVGVYEWIAGTRNALLVYWATDLGGSLAVTFGLILPLSLLGGAVGHELLHLRDVGMSGGGFGCIGALVHRLPPHKRRLAAGLGVAYLLARLATLTDVRADALHLLAFVGGFLLDGRFGHAHGDPRLRSDPGCCSRGSVPQRLFAGSIQHPPM